jgi:hypothetical protein
VVLYGYEAQSLTLREEHRPTGCWGEHFDHRVTKWWEVGENCIMKRFIICKLCQV